MAGEDRVEQSILVLILIIYLLAAIVAWLFGMWGSSRAVWELALTGLIVIGLGVAIVLTTWYVWAPAVSSSASRGLNLLAGLFILLPLLLGWGVELPGVILTLAACFIGLVQTARQRTGWFWVLLGAALVPLTISALTELFMPTIGQLTPQLGPDSARVYYTIQRGAEALPVIPAVVMTIYARRTPARGRTTATQRPTPRAAGT